MYFLRRRKEKKNQLVLNLFMDFCDQCESTQRGSVGPSSSQLMCLKGNYHWCCFPFLSGQRASRSCHGPPAAWEELPQSPRRSPQDTWVAWRGVSVDVRERQSAAAESNMPTVRESLGRANCESNQGWEYCLLIYPTKHTQYINTEGIHYGRTPSRRPFTSQNIHISNCCTQFASIILFG